MSADIIRIQESEDKLDQNNNLEKGPAISFDVVKTHIQARINPDEGSLNERKEEEVVVVMQEEEQEAMETEADPRTTARRSRSSSSPKRREE